MQAKSLLPKKSLDYKVMLVALFTLFVLLWGFFLFFSHRTHTQLNTLSSQIKAVTLYQNELKAATSSTSKHFFFNDQLATKSEIDLQLLRTLKQYPAITLTSVAPQKKKQKNQPNITQRYLTFLPNKKASMPGYYVTLSGPYQALSHWLADLISAPKPMLIQTLTLNGKNYPKDTLTLDLRFLSKE